MATWWAYYLEEFEGEEYAYAGSFAPYMANQRGIYFYEFVSDTNQDVIDILLDQTFSGDQIQFIATDVSTKANAVSASGEDEKWLEFKNSFPLNFQEAFQAIIDKERIGTIPATTFSSFAARSVNDHAQNILDLDTAPYDFWTPYVSYLKKRADESQTGWSLWLSSLSGDYKLGIAELVEGITYLGIPGLEDYTLFNVFQKLSPNLFAEKVFSFPFGGAQTGTNLIIMIYFSDLIKSNLNQVFTGYYATTIDRQNAFFQLFRTELQAPIQAYIDTLIANNYINTFDDLSDLPGTTLTTITTIDSPNYATAQKDSLSFSKLIVDRVIFESLVTGDILALNINDSHILYFTVNNPANIGTELAALITSTTDGDWSEVTANYSGSEVFVLANDLDMPFTLKSESVYSTIVGYDLAGYSTEPTPIGLKHPLYLALAQSILNDANATDTSNLEVEKRFRGTVFFKDAQGQNVPAANMELSLYDNEDDENPVLLSTVKTDLNGNYNFTYTLANAAKPKKALRLEAKDASGNVLKITTDLEPNIFLDAANGTFEGGTPPSYPEWNLTLGDDIEIASPQFLGQELQENWDFSESEGGWYTDYPQTTLFFSFIGGVFEFFGAIEFIPVYTANLFTIGKKYKITFEITSALSGTPGFQVRDADGNTLFSPAFDVKTFEFDWIATTNAISFQGQRLLLSYFSIKEILTEAPAYQGSFSPQFLLDAATPTDDFVFKGDTSIAVTTNTDYEVEAYVYFNSPLVDPAALINSGLYLRPVSYSFSDLLETTVHNGSHALLYASGEVKRNTDVVLGQWVRIVSKFNSEANTSITLGVYLKGTLADFTPNFSFMIDQVRLIKGAEESKEFDLVVDSIAPVNVFTSLITTSNLDAALAQAAGASLPQITHVFPSDVQAGDLFVLDLNHQGMVSFKAPAEATVASVTAGLTAAITVETADVTITTPTAAGPSAAQIDRLTIADVKIGAKYTFRLNGLAPVSYVASVATTANVTGGVTVAINAQTAHLVITEEQAPAFSDPQILHLTPQNVLVGAKFILEINGDTQVEYTAAAATVADVVAGLVTAINAGTGDWTKVTASNGGPNTHVIITADTNNVAFDIVQKGGGWKSVYATDDSANNRVVVTARLDNTPFAITQVGGKWKSVFATDETTYLSITADANNTPFDVYVKVMKASEAGTTVATALETLDIVLPAEINQVFLLKEIATIKDILFVGGLKNSLDGVLDFKITQQASSGVPHIIQVTPSNVSVGAIFKITINDSNTLTFVATEPTFAHVIGGLVAAINGASGDWTTVTATDLNNGTFSVVADSNNVVFTLTQTLAASDPVVLKLDAVASLSSVADDIGFEDDKKLEVVEKLIDAGFNSALAIAEVNKENFATTVNQIVGDFNATRLYELALVRKKLTTELVNDFLTTQQVYKKVVVDPKTSGKLTSIIEERCACDDCETAVSPLAYLTDLINYVGETVLTRIGSENTRLFNDKTLSNYFYQDFTELPASCEDVLNRVCQIRSATEVLRRYLKANYPSQAQLEVMNLAINAYVRDVYKKILASVGTSYDEVRMISSEADKRSLALRLGISYDYNPDYLEKLFFAPEVIAMASWADYLKVIPGGIQTLITDLSTDLAALSPSVDFDDFKLLSPQDLKAKLLLIDDEDDFMLTLGSLVHDTAASVQTKINALDLPFELKEQLKWDTFIYDSSQLFSLSFKTSFEVLQAAWRNKAKANTFADLATLSEADLTDYLITLTGFGNVFDFWLPFAGALRANVEDFSLSEKDIEHLFGLQDTTKDVYSDGAKINDDKNILRRWNIRGINWGQNTDTEGYIYLEMDEIAGVIELYKNAAKTSGDKVGVASQDATTGKFIIAEFNDSGLSGELIVTELDATSNIYISAVPLFLSWQLHGLRQLWLTADRFAATPVIDPDVIRTSDILFPYDINTVSPEKAIDFWEDRRIELSDQYDQYQSAREDATEDDAHYGSTGSGTTQFDTPNGLVLDANSVAYIADTANNRIQKLDGTTISTLTNTDISSPKGLVMTPDQKLIVLNSGSSLIKQISLAGAEEWSFGASGTSLGTFTNAEGVALSAKNDLFITDNPTIDGHVGRIQRFTLPTNISTYTQTAALAITNTVEAATGVKQVTTVVPSKVRVGDVFQLTLASVGTVTYTATTSNATEVVKGLLHQISLASWSAVVVENLETSLQFTATSANTPFTLSYNDQIPFEGLKHMTVDPEGNRYVSDIPNARVLKLNEDGQIMTVYGNAHGLNRAVKALLRFDEQTGTQARDSSGSTNLHSGTVAGDEFEWVTGGVTTRALWLKTEAYVGLASHADLDSDDFSQRSLELWFKAEDKDSATHQVLYKQGDHVQGMNIYLRSGELIVGAYGNAGGAWADFIATNRVQEGLWQHVVVVFNSTPEAGNNKFRAFLDGIEFTSPDQGNEGNAIEESASPDGVFIGALVSGTIRFKDSTVSTPDTTGYYFAGQVDNFRVWNRALDETEIDLLYSRGEDLDGTLLIPGALALDKANNLYVADTGNTGVLKFDATGVFVTKYGAYGTEEGNFILPSGIACDNSAEDAVFYVSDAENNTVQKFDSVGYTRTISPVSPFDAPSGLAVNQYGILYVADTGNEEVHLFDKDGLLIDTYTGFDELAPVSFEEPTALSIDTKGNLIVLDTSLNKLICMASKDTTFYVLNGGPWNFTTAVHVSLDQHDYAYLASGDKFIRTRFPEQITQVTTTSGITLSDPYFNTLAGIAIDARQNVWLADKNHHRILKMTLDGVYLNDIGKDDNTSGTGSGQFNAPEFVTTDESGNLYVSDTGNNRIQKFDNSGEFLTKWEYNAFTPNLSAPSGIAVNKDRKIYSAQRTPDFIWVVESMQGIGAALNDALNISLSDLLGINTKERQGEEITEDIAALYLSYNAYRQLLRLIAFAEKGLSLLEEQWTDLYNILVRSYKESCYALWKTQEQAAGIALSPDHFRYSELDEEYIPVSWRATERERKDWLSTLNDRIAQQDTLRAEHEETMTEIEDEVLIVLRNILLAATDFKGSTLEQKAQLASDRLLIDFKNACCQRTTRVAQALEVLQNFVWGLRNGIITDTFPSLYIPEEKPFEEEWKWMGSYATWKSAQLVFMYPENLLLPAYHRDQSPAFTKFTEDLRINSRLTVEAVNAYVADYFDYIDDVNSLTLLEAMQAPTLVATKSKEIRNQTKNYKNYIYTIARGGKTNSLYWNILDQSTTPATPASFWTKIELEKADLLTVVGLRQLRFSDDKRYLVLFLIDNTEDKAKLLHIRYDLEELSWNTEPTEIELEDFNDGYGNQEGDFRGVHIENGNTGFDIYKENGKYTAVSQKLTISVHRGLRQVFYASDKKFSSLKKISASQAYWSYKYGEVDGNGRVLRRAPEVFNSAPFYRREFPFIGEYRIADSVPNELLPLVRWVSKWHLGDELINNINPTEYIGQLIWPDQLDWRKEKRFYFYYDGTNRTQIKYLLNISDTTTGPSYTISGLPELTMISKAFTNDKGAVVVVFHEKATGLIKVQEMRLNSSNQLSFVGQANVLNPNMGIKTYPQPFIQQSNYKGEVSKAYTKVFSVNNKYYQRYVEELYYSVPVTAALALQQKAFYQEALDWFRLVYDYGKESKFQKTIYKGLYAESSAHDLIDDFEVNRNYPLSVDNQTFPYEVVENPDRIVNTSAHVAQCSFSNVVSRTLVYTLPEDHTIDLLNPNFSLYVLVPEQVPNGYIEIELGDQRVGANCFAIYRAYTTGSGWQKLIFQPNFKGTTPLNQVNVLKLRIVSGAAHVGKVCYIDRIQSGSTRVVYEKQLDWLSDPLNPHALAAQRSDAYNRYTILSIARCLVEYADSEYTQDTAESVPRARLLYETALELMKEQGLGGTQEACRDKINAFDIVLDLIWMPVWAQIKNDIFKVKEEETLDVLLENIKAVMVGSGTDPEKLKTIRTMVNVAKDDPELFRNISSGRYASQSISSDVYLALQSDPALYNMINASAAVIGQEYLNQVVDITGVSPDVLLSDRVFDDGTVMAQLKELNGALSSGTISLDMITGSTADLSPEALLKGGDPLNQVLMKDLKKSLASLTKYDVAYKPSTNLSFCVPSNPFVDSLRLTAEINLFKIRTCRNIAGEVRELDPYAAPIDVASGLAGLNGGANLLLPQNKTFKPSAYRYEVLIERSKQLVQIAQQVEASLLATLEKLDAERYNMLKAKQDLGLAKAGIKLQDLRVKEAESGVKLAELQRDKSVLQVAGLQNLIAAGLNDYEKTMVRAYEQIGQLSAILAVVDSGIASAQLAVQVANTNPSTAFVAAGAAAGAFVGLGARVGLSREISNASSEAQVASVWASFERRAQEWNFQSTLGTADIAIGNQQIKIARERVAVVNQERQIAQLQSDNAQATIDFLANKFSNAELYDWMSKVLESTYAYFLQQATGMSKLAAEQLAFERQQVVPEYIKSDYWQPVSDNLMESAMSSGDKTVDRKGVTGSTRLLQDIYQLDQFAFANDRRKLELTKSISLSTLAPVEFQKFKETGQLIFETSLSTFDRDFPGHYLRLIRSVKTSIIALVPPLDGIKATLTNTGISRVVVENNTIFRKIQVKRTPESVSLSAGTNANGLFELNPMNSDKLLPFEKTGVESQWILDLPKASNFFDFNTIADVIITIEYTALHSDLYRLQVIKDLDTTFRAMRSYSFKNSFPDQWYDINNPLGSDTSVNVSFKTSNKDFPVNLKNLKSTDLLMFFVKSDQLNAENAFDADKITLIDNLKVNGLDFAQGEKVVESNGEATAVNAIISTRSLAGEGWQALKNNDLEGTWTLSINNPGDLFTKGYITDILFVVTYEGEAPAWLT